MLDLHNQPTMQWKIQMKARNFINFQTEKQNAVRVEKPGQNLSSDEILITLLVPHLVQRFKHNFYGVLRSHFAEFISLLWP